MNLLELSELLLDEKQAEEYLLKVGILKTFTACEKCGSSRITKISRGRHRCNSCLSEWSNKKGSVLYNNNLSYSKFIGIVKCFAMDLTAIRTSHEMELEKTRPQKLYGLFREVIGEITIERINDAILKNESPTFTIAINKNIVSIGIDDDKFLNNDLFTVKRTRIPNKEASFSFHHSNVSARKIKSRLKNFPISQNHFWRYANLKLQSFRGTKLKHLYLYLKEIEFRYNNKNEKLFEKLVTKIARF